jgi:hypothetical protein
LEEGLCKGFGLFFIYFAINIVFFSVSVWNWYNDILNLLKNTDGRFSLLKDIFLSKHFSILFILQQFIGNNKRLILPLLNGLDNFFLSVLDEIFKIHFLDLFKDGIIQLKLLFLFHKKGSTNAVVNGYVGAKPGVVLDVIDFDSFRWINLQHF